MVGCRKVMECKITLEGMYLPIESVGESLSKKGFDTIERPLVFDGGNCIKAEIEVYRTIKTTDKNIKGVKE